MSDPSLHEVTKGCLKLAVAEYLHLSIYIASRPGVTLIPYDLFDDPNTKENSGPCQPQLARENCGQYFPYSI